MSEKATTQTESRDTRTLRDGDELRAEIDSIDGAMDDQAAYLADLETRVTDLEAIVEELCEEVDGLQAALADAVGEPERTNARVIELDDATDPDILTGEAAPSVTERLDMAHAAGGPTDD